MKTTLFQAVAADLELVDAGLLRVLTSQEALLTDIGTHLLQAGGKRLRPALFLLAAKIKNYSRERLLPIAVSLELIHMATLVHDDIIDKAETRRGFPTANARWGNLPSVLAGDFLFARAFANIAHINNSKVMQILAHVVSTMCEGEITQLTNAYNPRQTEGDYLRRIQMKTANFIAASCELGAILSDADDRAVAALADYGHCIGMAFQITDDILDITADARQLGKPAGNDLKQGIMTLPIIYALHNAAAREELRAMIETRSLNDHDVARGLEIIRSSDAIDYAYGLVERYLNRARDNLKVIDHTVLKSSLEEIAAFISQREF